MFASLFISALLASVLAQTSSDNSPLTTVTLAANVILAAPTSTSALSTIINTNAAVTTITLSGSALLSSTTSAASSTSQATVLVTSVITSTVCGSCSVVATGTVTVAPVATSIRISTLSSVTTSVRNATTSAGVPYGGNTVFPVNKGNSSSNGTVAITSAGETLNAGSLAISAGLLAASYFALAL